MGEAYDDVRTRTAISRATRRATGFAFDITVMTSSASVESESSNSPTLSTSSCGYMDSDDEDWPSLSNPGVIQPYMYEPVASEVSVSDEESDNNDNDRLNTTEWQVLNKLVFH